MASAAFSTTIKAGGPSASLTNEACTEVTAGFVFQITNAAKRILDPSEDVTVDVDGVEADPDDYVVDYLFGKVTFSADQGGGNTVRVTAGSYLTPVAVAQAKEFELTVSQQVEDASYFVSDGFARKLATLRDASGSVSTLTTLQTELASGGAGDSTILSEKLTGGTPFLLEIHPSATGDKFRAWVLLESAEESGSATGLYSGKINWKAAPVKGSNQTEAALFGFGT